jgi:phosphate/sulfate permease
MDGTLSFSALVALIFVALAFDFLNGLHDAANSIATVVSTRVLRPQYAVIWAAFFNFIAFLFFGLHVAQTVGTGIVAAEVVDAAVIFGVGIIAVLLYSQGFLGAAFYVPFWVILTCQAAMGLGTLFGGWRIVHTMGSKITRLHPVQGFCAEVGGAITLFLATYLGIPVSTTHTITGAIIGVGAARKVAAVRWNVASNVVFARIVTLPVTALFGSVFYELGNLVF